MTAKKQAADLTMGDVLRDWDPREYLDYYYDHPRVADTEAMMFRFVARALRHIGKRFATGLEIGCGPVVHHAAQLIPWVEQIDMADVHESNLEEIRRWLRQDPHAFDFSVFIRAALDAEDGLGGSLAEREALLRARINLMRCDLRDAHPLTTTTRYPLVTSFYCTEWVIPNLEGWRQTMRHVTGLLDSGGWLIFAGAHATDFCRIKGDRRIPSAHLTKDDIQRTLGDLNFDTTSIQIETAPGLDPDASGLQGAFMAYARLS
jgi:hypothetical protein